MACFAVRYGWRPLIFIVAVLSVLLPRGGRMGAGVDFRFQMLVTLGILGCLAVIIRLTSIVDYFQFQGWEVCADDSAASKTVESFVTTVLAFDFDTAYELCSPSYQTQKSAFQFQSRVEEILNVLGPNRSVLQLDEPGRFRRYILSGALKLLNEVLDTETTAVGLALFGRTTEEVGPANFPTLRIVLHDTFLGLRVDSFDLVATGLNQAEM
jgi:hypothetical protein